MEIVILLWRYKIKNQNIHIFCMMIQLMVWPLIANTDSKISMNSQSKALWLSLGLGAGGVFDTDRDNDYYGEGFFVDFSGHLRRHHTVISGGMQGCIDFIENISYIYITYGKSLYQTKNQEVFLSAGISRNQHSWNDDMSEASGIDAIYLGIPVQFQVLFHFPVGMGLGMTFDMNLNYKAIMISMGFQVSLGNWQL